MNALCLAPRCALAASSVPVATLIGPTVLPPSNLDVIVTLLYFGESRGFKVERLPG